MWKRSEVEQLTGLTRHMIQDLCNQNTSGDGLAFWVPAVSKPGYSRFDEGDLFMFYLVKQLMKAGFTLREVEPAVYGLCEDDSTFFDTLHAKGIKLEESRSKLDENLTALHYLEEVSVLPAGERLYAVMSGAVSRNADRAVLEASNEMEEQGAWAASEDMRKDACQQVRIALQRLLDDMLSILKGLPLSSVGYGSKGQSGEEMPIAIMVRNQLRGSLERGVDASANEVQALIGDLAHALSTNASRHGGLSLRLATVSLAHFLKEPENGVPIELVFGAGSFALLSSAAEIYRCSMAWEGKGAGGLD